jgi:hypothetical protein
MSINISDPWTAVLKSVTDLVTKFIPDPAQKAAAQLEILRMNQQGELEQLKADVQIALAQAGVDDTEAKSDSAFKSYWRPFIGWVCGSGLAYQVVVRPIIGWLAENIAHWTQPPSLDLNTLMPLLGGMLGLGAYRTLEKIKGVS